MSGYTKSMFDKDLAKISKDLNNYINDLRPLLPYNFDIGTIKLLLEQYYPYELFLINEKYQYYCAKENYLQKKGKKPRYVIEDPFKMVEKSASYKKIIDPEFISQHQKHYDEGIRKQLKNNFVSQRNPKIKKTYDKIHTARLKTQQTEPEFIDVLMGLYDRKSTSQKDKVYILLELQKYYCPKILLFFNKKVDTEYNFQLRSMALENLQSLGFQPVLRKQKYMQIKSRNKKRRSYLKNVYAKEKFSIQAIPEELEYRIENSKEQLIKSYDFFISHNSLDFAAVQRLIQFLNDNGNNIYCDWINDNDYLKRNLVGRSTLSVVEKRLEQSNAMLFVHSNKSEASKWCIYELNFFSELKKPIYTIRKDAIEREDFSYSLLEEHWFMNTKYRDLDLF